VEALNTPTIRRLTLSCRHQLSALAPRFIADITAQWYERAIRAQARGRLLDLGCGDVPLYGVYRDLVQEHICINWANSLHPSIHLDFAVDLGGKLPFEDGSFDTILVTDVLEHLAEPAGAMCETAGILRLGGKLIIGVRFFYWIHEEPHDYHWYTEFALQRMCQLSGLSIVELQGVAVFRKSCATSHPRSRIPSPPPPCTTSAVSYRCIAVGSDVVRTQTFRAEQAVLSARLCGGS
jgi:SAM-dependent methyltransferase